MTNNDTSNDKRLDERMPATAPAAATKSHDRRVALGEPASDGDHDLDSEVSSFLESEFFADHGYAIVSSPQTHTIESSVFQLNGELQSMELDVSMEMPDEHFGDVGGEDFGDSQATADSTADDALCILFQPPQLQSNELPQSLRVVIPASALLPPPPNAHRQRKAKSSTPTVKQTKGRKRVKDELEYLRLQVQEFEDKLERLRQGSSSAGSSPPVSPFASSLNLTETEPSDASPHSTLWERVAKRQRNETRRSQVKNAKLKEMLEDQLQLARSLSKALQQREDLTWLEALDPGQSMHKQFGGAAENTEATFDVLAAQVETLYGEVDAVLFEAGLVGTETEAHSAQVKTDGSENLYIEVVDCNTLPFDVHTTGAAIWLLMSTSSIQFDSGKFQAIQVTADTIRAQLTVTLRVRRLDTSVRMSLIVKRVVEADRIVFVWCAMGETQGHVFQNECVQVRERGWTIVSASSDAGVDDEETKCNQHEPLTTIQNVVRMVPELDLSGLSSENAEDHVGVLTDVMLSSLHQNLAMLRQIIGNTIRGDAVCSESSTY